MLKKTDRLKATANNTRYAVHFIDRPNHYISFLYINDQQHVASLQQTNTDRLLLLCESTLLVTSTSLAAVDLIETANLTIRKSDDGTA